MVNTLALTTLASFVTALLYGYVAKVLHGRQVSSEARLARDLFALWWALLGALSVAGAVQVTLYLTGHLPIWVYQTISQVALAALFAALWALQAYLVYLYKGSRGWMVPLGVFYAALYVATVGLVHYIGAPESLSDDGWRLRTEPEVRFSQAFNVVFLLVLIGPQMVAAVSYARLFSKTKDRTQRFRIAVLTGSILIWFGTSAIVGASSDPEAVNVPWQIAQRLLSIGAASAILMAYKPPGWLRERLGIHGLEGVAP